MSKSKTKGDREERDVVNTHLRWGFQCERTLESGARSNSPVTWDINLHIDKNTGYLGAPERETLKGECKVRANGFKEIYRWIENVDFLTIRADRRERLYVIPERIWKELL